MKSFILNITENIPNISKGATKMHLNHTALAESRQSTATSAAVAGPTKLRLNCKCTNFIGKRPVASCWYPTGKEFPVEPSCTKHNTRKQNDRLKQMHDPHRTDFLYAYR